MKLRLILFSLLTSVGVVLPVNAAVQYWDSNGSIAGAGITPAGTWGTSLFWNPTADGTTTTPGPWVSGDDAVFSAGSDATGPFTVTLSGTQTAKSILIEEGQITFAGTGAAAITTNFITLNPGTKLSIDTSARLSAFSNAVMNLDGAMMENNATGNAGSFIPAAIAINVGPNGAVLAHTVTNILSIVQTGTGSVPPSGTTIAGQGGITKAGIGVLAIATACTYQGPTIITNGELRIRTTANRLPTTTAVNIVSPGILNLNGVNQQIGSLTGTGDVGLGNGVLTVGDSTTTIFNGAIKDVANFGAGAVTTGTGRVSKQGSGTLTFAGVNSFTGSYTNTSGTTTVNTGASLCGPGADLIVTGGTVNLNNVAQTVLSLSGSGGTVNLGSGHALTVNPGATRTFSGVLAGPGALTKTGTATFILAGNNSYEGATLVSTGRLQVNSPNALGSPNAGTEIVSGAELLFDGSAINITLNEPIRIAGIGLDGGAITVQNSSTVTNNAPITLTADAQLTVSGTATAAYNNANAITSLANESLTLQGGAGVGLGGTISGAISLGTGRLTKLQGGRWVLGQANDYSGGTIVGAGTLEIQHDVGLGTGNVIVSNGASLKVGSGTANTYIASSAGLILVGAAPVVNLAFSGVPNTIHSLSFDGGATFKAAGTWGAPGSGAAHTDVRFLGTGMLDVTTGPATSTVLATSADSATYGTPITLTATVSGGLSTPTGNVTLMDGSQAIGSAPLVGGSATFNISPLSVSGSPHSLTALYNGDADHNSSASNPISESIGPKSITPVVTANNKPYDGTASATIGSRALNGILSGDDVSLGTSGVALFNDATIGIAKAVNVSGLALFGAAAGNYVLTSDTVLTSANIASAPLTIIGVSAENKIYDGTTAATLTGTPALSGVVGSEDVQLIGTAAGSFLNKTAASGKSIPVTGLSLSGADANNYTLSPLTLIADITKLPLSVSGITAENKPYDGSTNAVLNLTNAVLSAILAGDVVSLVTSNANGSFADADVGDGKTVTISGLFLAGADAENYSITQPEATADIKRALSVTAITAADKTYDGTMTVILNVANAAISGVVPGDDVELNASAATGEFVDKNAAIGKTVSIDGLSITGTDASKYLLTKTTATATINPAALVVSASGINKLYDGSNSASVTLNDNRLSNDNLTVSYTSAEFSDKAVGGSKPIAIDGISISGIDAVNYIINSSATTTADILQRALTVTVVGGNKTYDASTAASIILSDDRVSGDSLTVGFSSANFADKNAGTGKTVTVNGVNLSGPDAVNYSLSSSTLTGIADITARALLITATGQSRVYDGTSVAVVALADDRVPGDLFTSTYVSASFQDKNTGLAKAISVTGIAITGTDAGNYIANTTSSTTADINPAPLSVTGIIANNKTYDGTVTATVLTSSAALNGRIAGDDVLLIDNAVTAAFAGAQPGTGKTVTISGLTVGGADAINYVLNQPTAQADILAAELTVTGLIASDKTYDGSSNAVVNFSSASLLGVISGDVVTIDSSAASANFADKNVGVAKVVEIRGLNLSGQDAAKYVLTQPATNATITPADLTVTANGASRVYGGPDLAFSANLSGFVGGDDATVVSGTPSFSTTATVTSAPGAYSITPALGSLTALNYEFSSFIAGTLAVTTAGTTNSLLASANPSRESSNVVFIVMLTPLAPATGIPGGAVVFAVNGTPFSTNSLVNGETSASTFSLPVGTNLITAEYLGDTNFSGSTNSLQQVVEPTCSQINNLLGMSDNSDGTFTLSFTGTPGAQYFVITSSDILQPISNWTPLTGSTNTVTNSSGIWSLIVTNAAPQGYYRSAAVSPCP